MPRLLFLMAVVVLTTGCGTQKPVLYPNDHLKTLGPAQAESDIAQCQQLAEEYVKANPGKEVAKSTAVGAGTGAIIGTVAGAVTGSVGTGAGVGAATGATGGLLHGLFKASAPSPLHKSYVEKCLRDKGYEIVGWQ
ncbi:MAG: cell envelope biogenesis protein OmpA [Desulfobacterales bacterium]|nr:MAG: cell envelope biogenesis protein OmpA [Desulfobacterales bacterium]